MILYIYIHAVLIFCFCIFTIRVGLDGVVAFEFSPSDVDAILTCCGIVNDDDNSNKKDTGALLRCANTTTSAAISGWKKLSQISNSEHSIELSSKSLPPKTKMKIGIISYVSEEISAYASYASAINAAWALSHNYSFTLANAKECAYEVHDMRWNKVKIMQKALHAALSSKNQTTTTSTDAHTSPSTDTGTPPLRTDTIADAQEWGYDLDAIVWLDSDLIILDFNFDLEDLIAQANADTSKDVSNGNGSGSRVDIIASRDPRPENGLINTGALLVMATPASLEFFTRWWDRDHTNGMDQHAFDQLFEEQQQQKQQEEQCIQREHKRHEQEHEQEQEQEQDHGQKPHSNTIRPIANIKMLSPNKFNSQFPAWKNQLPNDPILHLAGVSNIARYNVFEKAYKEVCRAACVTSSSLSSSSSSCSYLSASITTASVSTNEFKSASSLHSQLGIHRQVLHEIIMDFSLAWQVALVLIQDIHDTINQVRHARRYAESIQAKTDTGVSASVNASVNASGIVLPDLKLLYSLHARARDIRQTQTVNHGNRVYSQFVTAKMNLSRTLYTLQWELWELLLLKQLLFSSENTNTSSSLITTTTTSTINKSNMTTNIRTSTASEYSLHVIQILLDAAFNLLVDMDTNTDINIDIDVTNDEDMSMEHQEQDKIQILTNIGPVLHTLYTMLSTTPLALQKAYYFSFKRESFLAEALANVSTLKMKMKMKQQEKPHDQNNDDSNDNILIVEEAEVQALQRAWEIWIVMHNEQSLLLQTKTKIGSQKQSKSHLRVHSMQSWAGAGNQLADPAKEAILIRARFGALLCESPILFNLDNSNSTRSVINGVANEGSGRRLQSLLLLQKERGYSALMESTELILSKWSLPLEQSIRIGAGTGTGIDSTASVHVPAYVLSTLMGVYLSRASCCLAYARTAVTGTGRSSSLSSSSFRHNLPFASSAQAHQALLNATIIYQHVKKLTRKNKDRDKGGNIIEDLKGVGWGYDKRELIDMINEFKYAIHKVNKQIWTQFPQGVPPYIVDLNGDYDYGNVNGNGNVNVNGNGHGNGNGNDEMGTSIQGPTGQQEQKKWRRRKNTSFSSVEKDP